MAVNGYHPGTKAYNATTRPRIVGTQQEHLEETLTIASRALAGSITKSTSPSRIFCCSSTSVSGPEISHASTVTN